eukprot:scaffold671_cov286-Chaetoceros_neogracile.AAC.2
MVDTLMKTETAIEKTKRSTKVLSRVALFLGELRDGLTMLAYRSIAEFYRLPTNAAGIAIQFSEQ